MQTLDIEIKNVIGSFKNGDINYEIVDIGNIVFPNGQLYFPNTYIINLNTNEQIPVTNMYKSGVIDFKFDNKNQEIHLYGNNTGQGFDWDRYNLEGSYLGYINEDDT